MRKTALLVTTLIVGALLSLTPRTSAAHEHELKWRLRTELVSFDPTGHIASRPQGDDVFHSRLKSAAGFGLTGEYRFSYYYGINVSLLKSRSFVVTNPTNNPVLNTGSISPLSLGINFHLTPEHPIDAYIGAFVAWVSFGDTTVNENGLSQRIPSQDDFGWGLIAGADIPLGRRGWMIHGSIRYLKVSLQTNSGPVHVDGKIDPLIVSVGVGFRY